MQVIEDRRLLSKIELVLNAKNTRIKDLELEVIKLKQQLEDKEK